LRLGPLPKVSLPALYSSPPCDTLLRTVTLPHCMNQFRSQRFHRYYLVYESIAILVAHWHPDSTLLPNIVTIHYHTTRSCSFEQFIPFPTAQLDPTPLNTVPIIVVTLQHISQCGSYFSPKLSQLALRPDSLAVWTRVSRKQR
jgi:hypothetical protein